MNFERSLLENKGDDELSTTTLLVTVFLDSALLAKNAELIELLARDELTACPDRELERLSLVVIAERLLARYSTELTCSVGVTVIGGAVWIIVETGEIGTPCVVETFATDTLGLRSGEEVMLRFMLSPEVVSTLCRLGVNAPDKRVVVTTDVTDGELSTTKLCVSSGREKFVLLIVLTDDEGALLILNTLKDVPWVELLFVMLCNDSILDTPGVSNDLL